MEGRGGPQLFRQATSWPFLHTLQSQGSAPWGGPGQAGPQHPHGGSICRVCPEVAAAQETELRSSGFVVLHAWAAFRLKRVGAGQGPRQSPGAPTGSHGGGG